MRRATVFLSCLWASTAVCLAEPQVPDTPVSDPQAIFKELSDYVGGQSLDFQTRFEARGLVRDLRGTVHYAIMRPNKFRIEASIGKKTFVLVSDGTKMIVYNPQKHRYTEVSAPATAADGLNLLAGLTATQSQILLFLSVLQDLAEGASGTSVVAVGKETIGNRQCTQFKAVENETGWYPERWEIWLEQRNPPLPCKFKVVRDGTFDRTVETNEVTWRIHPSFSEDDFSLVPPKGSRKTKTVGELQLLPPVH